MRARFSRAALTATLILGSVGLARGGELDGVFADLDAPAGATRPDDAATARPAAAPARLAAASVPARPDPLGMDAIFDADGGDRGGEGSRARVVEVVPPAPAGTERGEAAPTDIRTRVLAPTPEPLAAPARRASGNPAKGPVAAKSDLDPEPDVAIKPPAATPTLDPLDAPTAPAAPVPAGAPHPSGVPQPPGPGDVTSVGSPAPPLLPLNAAIRAALDKRDALAIRGANARERRKEREAVAAFYAARGWAPVWSDGGRPVDAVASVMARLARADEDALAVPSPPVTLATDGAPDAVAAGEVALTDAVVAYARQASGARVDPKVIGPLIGARPRLADPAAVLASLPAAGSTAGDALRDFNPVEPRYVALRDKLGQLRAARARSARAISPGPPLRVGMRDARVPSLRARFALAGGDGDPLAYDAPVAAAVADFQRANGLPPSGELTRRTVALLGHGQAAPPARLEGTLVANMEMWRWMPRDLGRDRIEVDVPAFTVTVFHGDVPVAHNRVVVGKVDTPTPLFSNTMKYLIVNPVWNVPESIVDKELLRKDGDAGGIRARGFDVSYRNGRLVVKQPAGERNALGRVKFMFPNDYAVYLHDTPAKALFSTTKRAYSHGCVRVDQPFDFAASVLNDGVNDGTRGAWSQERLHKLLGDKEHYVNLPQPLPIHIEYFTATVDPDGQRLQLRDDVYDYAGKVAAALGEGGGSDGAAARPALATTRRHPRTLASD